MLVIISLLMASFSEAQKETERSEGLSIEPCTKSIGVATLNNLSGFWSYEKNAPIGELDSSLYQYYPDRKCLIEIRTDDSLFFYDMRYEEPKFLFASKDELRVDVINDSLIGFWGKSFFLGGHTHDIEGLGSIMGEFGVELLGNTAIIVDYKYWGAPKSEPVKDDNGEPIMRVDSISGLSFYLYEPGLPGFTKGGARDRLTKNWVIEPCANWIVKGHSTYVVEKRHFLKEMYSPDVYYYSIYDHNGETIQDSLSESQLLGNPDYLKMMVPLYDCDSVFSKEQNITFMLPGRLYFTRNGKTGYFSLASNHISQRPVDFMNSSFGDVRTIIDEDSIQFQLYYDGANKLRFDLKAGDSYGFYPVGESDTHRDHGNFRIKENGTDSVYIFHYEPYSNSTRSVTTVEYDSSYLKTLIEEPFSNDCFRLNMLWRYGIEVYEDGILNVTNTKLKFFEEPPRNYSGVFDLKTHEWMIENKYHSIIRTNDGYVAYLVDPKQDDSAFDSYSLNGVLLTD